MVINGGAFLGPAFYFRRDRQRMEEIQGQLSTRLTSLQTGEERLRRMQEEVGRVQRAAEPLGKRIKAVEAKYPKGIPGGAAYQGYLKTVREYNEKAREQNRLATEYRAALDAYRDDVQEYNALGTEANGIARKIRSAWSVVPVPLPSPVAPMSPTPADEPAGETSSGTTAIGVQE